MNKEKLTEKDICPYLPYYLEGFYGNVLIKFRGINNDAKSGGLSVHYWDNMSISKNSGMPKCKPLYYSGVLMFKPILRPLSDLTDDILKEIFNDEQLVVDRLKYAIIVKYQSMGEWFKEIIPIREVTDDRNGHLIYTAWLFIELCKRHFDVFGLIPQGLAIDKNTLK